MCIRDRSWALPSPSGAMASACPPADGSSMVSPAASAPSGRAASGAASSSTAKKSTFASDGDQPLPVSRRPLMSRVPVLCRRFMPKTMRMRASSIQTVSYTHLSVRFTETPTSPSICLDRF